MGVMYPHRYAKDAWIKSQTYYYCILGILGGGLMVIFTMLKRLKKHPKQIQSTWTIKVNHLRIP